MIDGGQSGTRHGDGAAYCYTRTGFFQQIADVPLDLRRNTQPEYSAHVPPIVTSTN